MSSHAYTTSWRISTVPPSLNVQQTLSSAISPSRHCARKCQKLLHNRSCSSMQFSAPPCNSATA